MTPEHIIDGMMQAEEGAGRIVEALRLNGFIIVPDKSVLFRPSILKCKKCDGDDIDIQVTPDKMMCIIKCRICKS